MPTLRQDELELIFEVERACGTQTTHTPARAWPSGFARARRTRPHMHARVRVHTRTCALPNSEGVLFIARREVCTRLRYGCSLPRVLPPPPSSRCLPSRCYADSGTLGRSRADVNTNVCRRVHACAVMLGNPLCNSTGPPLYKPLWAEHKEWVFGSQYFMEIYNRTSNNTGSCIPFLPPPLPSPPGRTIGQTKGQTKGRRLPFAFFSAHCRAGAPRVCA